MEFILLAIAIAFLSVILARPLFSKVKIPLSFSAMFVGMVLGLFPRFQEVAGSETFSWFANLGMLFMIFAMIFRIASKDKKNAKKDSHFAKYLVKSGFIIIILELAIVIPIVYFFLEQNWYSALLISLIFTTVNEAMILPFLEKFNILNSKLGKSIIGIGVLDNAFEYLVILLASFSAISGGVSLTSSAIVGGITVVLFFGLKFSVKTEYMKRILLAAGSHTLFLFSIGLLFLFAGLLGLINMEFIGAFLAAFLAKDMYKVAKSKEKKELSKSLDDAANGLFAPVFFLSVGLVTNISLVLSMPVIALIFVLVGFVAKILPTLLATSKELGWRSSVLLGICLKFGSGIIFVKLLFEYGMIKEITYTLVVAAILLYRVIIPFLLAYFIPRWKKFIV